VCQGFMSVKQLIRTTALVAKAKVAERPRRELDLGRCAAMICAHGEGELYVAIASIHRQVRIDVSTNGCQAD
jgi:hypothetical protein